MLKPWKLCLSVVFLACFVGAIRPLEARAMAVSPVQVEFEAGPGEVKNGTIQITNTGDIPQVYSIFTRRFVPKGEEGQQDFIEGDGQNELPNWIVPEMRQISVSPHETRVIRYEVRVPRLAIPGGQYAALFFSTHPLEQAQEQRIGTSVNVGVLFLVQVRGEIREHLSLQRFVRTSSSLFGPIQFEARLKNEGNSHVRPHGSLVIQNLFGRVVWRQAFNLEERVVLPNSVHRFEVNWFDPWALGRYNVHLEINYGLRGSLISPSISVWSVSWRMVFVYLVGLIILGIVFRMRYTRLVR